MPDEPLFMRWRGIVVGTVIAAVMWAGMFVAIRVVM